MTVDPDAESAGRRFGSRLLGQGRRPGRAVRMLVPLGAVVLAGGMIVAGTTLASAASTPQAPSTTGCGATDAKLTVEGSGTATATPDLVTVEVDVSTRAPTAQAALSDNNQRTAAVVGAFKAGGVTSADLQTTNVTVQPDYSYSPTTGSNTIVGYVVDDTVTAKLHDVSSAGATPDAVSQAAGDAGQINSVSFSVGDPRSLEDQARSDAVRQAVDHARAMAASAGERLGPVCSMTDTNPSPQPVPLAAGSAAQAEGQPVPLQPGTQQVEAQVTLVYALAPGSTGA